MASGHSVVEAAAMMDMEAEEASAIVSSPHWVDLVRRYHTTDDAVRDEFMSLVPLALRAKREILSSEKASLSLKERVASDVLNRLGYDRVGSHEAPSMKVPNIDHVKAVFIELFRAGRAEDDEGQA